MESTQDRNPHTISRSLQETTHSHSSSFTDLATQSSLFWNRFERTNTEADLEQCIQCSRHALAAAKDQKMGRCLTTLGFSLLERHALRGYAVDLEEAISLAHRALEDATADDSPSDKRFHLLGLALRIRHEESGQIEDVEQSIDFLQKAVNAAPADTQNIAKYLAALSMSFKQQYNSSNQVSHLEKAIECGMESLERASPGHPDRALCLHALGSSLVLRYQKSYHTTDLNQCLAYCCEALILTPQNHPKRPLYHHSLAVVHLLRYRRFGQVTELDCSLRHAILALGKSHSNPARMAVIMRTICSVYNSKYTKSVQMPDLEAAIEVCQQALDLLPANHSRRPSLLADMSSFLGERSKKLDKPEDLAQAIKHAEEALALIPKGSSERATYLQIMGKKHYDAFERYKKGIDLDRGIQFFQDAISSPLSNPLERRKCFKLLGMGFHNRYTHNRQMADLDQAIEYLKRAADTAPSHNPGEAAHAVPSYDIGRALCLKNLGVSYGLRFQLTRQESDIDRAVETSRTALGSVPIGHRDRPDFQLRLAEVLRRRLKRAHLIEDAFIEDDCIADDSVVDLDEAIQLCRDALLAADSVYQHRKLSCLLQLGELFRLRAGKTRDEDGEEADLRQSIKYLEEAREMTTYGDLDYCTCRFQMGLSYGRLMELTGSANSLMDSVAAMTEVFGLSPIAVIKFAAGEVIIVNAIQGGHWDLASFMIDKIISLLPDVILPSGSRNDALVIAQHVSAISKFPATIHLKANKSAIESLEALESFRGFISSLLLDTKSDISLLKQLQPELWGRYVRCQDQISELDAKIRSPLFPEIEGRQNYPAVSRQRAQLFETLQDLRGEIRQCPGFERFLQSPKGKEVIDLAKDGPIVSFNIDSVSPGAFLVTTMGVEFLSLPNLDPKQIQNSVDVLGSRSDLETRNAKLVVESENTLGNPSTHLANLWENAVKPVLQRLGMLNDVNTTERLPRIWWVGGGIMSHLPLHAAGTHTPGTRENAMSHVISSYVPNLKTLQFLRRIPSPSINVQTSEILVVYMPETPGDYRRLNLAEEVDAINRHWGATAAVTNLDRPSKQRVLESLKTCTIAHFACHGKANSLRPLESALILGRHVAEELTINDAIDVIRRTNGQVAYLSACHTAEIKMPEFVHESLHLASAFQLAGFQHVIGTLWKANDYTASAIASNFYEALEQEGSITGESISFALHSAVMQYRQEADNSDKWVKWAPFIHLGC